MSNVRETCLKAKNAALKLAAIDSNTKNMMLECISQALLLNADKILDANKKDIENAKDLSSVMIDRLTLNMDRIKLMADGVKEVMKISDPVGEITEKWELENGLKISKVRVPIGVIGVIYEARPNVTIDVASLCLKSGNAVVLRGGKEAINSNKALFDVISNALKANNFDENVVGFINDTSRDSTKELLTQNDCVDLIIPRGGEGLKHFIMENSSIPVIYSAGGNCHMYVHSSADVQKTIDVLYNAKMQRPSVCNALEQLLIDRKIAKEVLPVILKKLIENNCRIKGSKEVVDIIKEATLATDEDYYKEHLDYELAVYIVEDYNEAIDRINEHNTKHSDSIMAEDEKVINEFVKRVDTSCTYVNASTRFTDGYQFGFGAEIAISTQKLHARGPLGLKQLTSEKYIIIGNGQVRK